MVRQLVLFFLYQPKSALCIALMLSPGKQEREKSQRRLLPLPTVSCDSPLQAFHTVAQRQHRHELCTHDSSVPGSWRVSVTAVKHSHRAGALGNLSQSPFCDLVTSHLCPVLQGLKRGMEEETETYQFVCCHVGVQSGRVSSLGWCDERCFATQGDL